MASKKDHEISLKTRKQVVKLAQVASRGYKVRAELAAIQAEWEGIRASLVREIPNFADSVPVYW